MVTASNLFGESVFPKNQCFEIFIWHSGTPELNLLQSSSKTQMSNFYLFNSEK